LVSGKTITIPFSDETVALNKLFIKNAGEKITSVRCYNKGKSLLWFRKINNYRD